MARRTIKAAHPLNEAVAAELRAEIGRQRIAVVEVAKRSGLNERTLHRLLKAETSIDVAQLEAVALALHLTPHTILVRAERAVLARGGDIEGWAGRPGSETGS